MFLPVSSALLIVLFNGAHHVFVAPIPAKDESAEGKIIPK